MRFVIFGAGAVGSVIGAHLNRAGADVLLIGDGPHIDKVKADGLTLSGRYGEFVCRPAASCMLNDWDYRSDDIVFLAVKTYDTQVALEQLAAKVPTDTPMFCFQNTMSNEEMAAERFSRVYAVALHLGARYVFPGEVSHLGGNTLVVGRYPEGQDETAKAVVAALNSSGREAILTDTIVPYKWAKFCVNLLNSPLAILGLSGAEAMNRIDTRRFLAEVFDEAHQVLSKAGTPMKTLPGDRPLPQMVEWLRGAYTPKPLPERSQQVFPSMWQDIYCRRGRTEARYLNGRVAELGRQVSIDTPVNALLPGVVDGMAERRELPGTYALSELYRMLGR